MNLAMRQLTRPRRPQDPIRLHYINEWAERRNMNQQDIADELDVNKATVSKWFNGALPSEANLPRIAAMFGVEVYELFMLPEDTWLANFVKGRSKEATERMRLTLEVAFPPRTGTDD